MILTFHFIDRNRTHSKIKFRPPSVNVKSNRKPDRPERVVRLEGIEKEDHIGQGQHDQHVTQTNGGILARSSLEGRKERGERNETEL